MIDSTPLLQPDKTPLRVFFTVDTEFSPRDFRADRRQLKALIARDIDGVTREGSFGIGYQMSLLESHGLRAVFQIEALSAAVIGKDELALVVDEVQRRGHEVQLHVHAEWLDGIAIRGLPPFHGKNLVSYSADEQTSIIGYALAILRDAGARDVCAFRAGNFGANHDTLRAAARSGLRYDSSYNVCFRDPSWAAPGASLLTQAAMVDGLCEVPISFFSDWPGHQRPAQLCACSGAEMEHALLAAHDAGWKSFVIVSHSFELIKRPRNGQGDSVPDLLVAGRMDRICRFLAAHREKFQTVTFRDVKPEDLIPAAPCLPLRSKRLLTVRRMAEQVFGRPF